MEMDRFFDIEEEGECPGCGQKAEVYGMKLADGELRVMECPCGSFWWKSGEGEWRILKTGGK